MYGGANCAFQQIVDSRCDEDFAVDFINVNQAFVGVHHIFEVDFLVGHESERVRSVIFLVSALHIFQLGIAAQVERGEDAAREATTHRNEVEFAIKTWLEQRERLADFEQMLMLERLVDAHIVVTP